MSDVHLDGVPCLFEEKLRSCPGVEQEIGGGGMELKDLVTIASKVLVSCTRG